MPNGIGAVATVTITIVTVLAGGTCAAHAQDRGATTRPFALVRIVQAGGLRPRETELRVTRTSEPDYRVEPSSHIDRSAHTRALDEMNAINNRRPRVFRFRPVMALTFDAADLDGPTRMAGIAPSLVGMKRKR